MTSDPPIRQLLAPNPSPLTGKGTNTWVVGATDLAVIDPGPDAQGHLEAILGAVGPGQRISHVVVTHTHLDHSALARRLSAATGAPIHAFGTATDGRSPLMDRLAPSLPAHAEGLDRDFRPDHCLAEGQTLHGPDWSLAVLHTPGHLGNHICLALGDLLFSGDHVMGWSSTIISPPDGDMADYMASLARLAAGSWRRLLPGHGDPVADPAGRLAELVTHRRQREAQILRALTRVAADIPDLTRRVYLDTPRHLLPAAERNVLAHLIDLEARKLVAAEPDLRPDARFVRR
ncbi:MBL fold metallo-hydrolase [Tabrizicola sp.]|uniref:MBL fold metallo-hydrolase n=1 Tax=Tabrizicola sp. TaxID=2005166 RepID=UPI0027356D73|nr:MBL fold metallo-hydrolase [Tabrizicola sp.]MDP3195719.1 MBL fold metallo-hydrolase [Tabrizicola sp.]